MSNMLTDLPDDILLELIKSTGVKFCQACKKLDTRRSQTGVTEVWSALKHVTLAQINDSLKRVNYNKVALDLTKVNINMDYWLLPEITAKLPNLASLKIEDDILHEQMHGKYFARAISQSLDNCIYITSLDLSRCFATDQIMKEIFESLQFCSFLKSINVENNYLNLNKTDCVADTLPSIKSLEILKIGGSENRISRTGGFNLGGILHRCTNLHVLSLQNDTRTNKIQGLAPGLALCTTLRALDLKGIHMGIEGMHDFAPSLFLCTWLTVLEIERNYLDDEGATTLASVITGCSSLTTLNVADNLIQDEGCIRIAESMLHVPTLQVLNLNDNEVGDKGVQRLCEVLLSCTNLVVLQLQWNIIRDDSAKSFANVLPKLVALKELDLQQNEITDTGATSLAEALNQPLSLSKLHLGMNDFTDSREIEFMLHDVNVNSDLWLTIKTE